MHQKKRSWFNKAQRPFLHPNLSSNKLVAMLCACHKKPSQGAHMNFMGALIFLHFHFCKVRGRSMQGLKCHHFVNVWALCLCFCATYVILFFQKIVNTCSCEVKGKEREVEEEIGSNQCLGHERRNWFKEKMCLELIQFFLKIQLWNCKL
jgi:hypothetical protein